MPLSLCLVFPVIYGVQTHDLIGVLLLVLLIPVIFYKHLPNLKRIAAGREMRLSWLWNAKAEEARLKKNMPEEEWNRIYQESNRS